MGTRDLRSVRKIRPGIKHKVRFDGASRPEHDYYAHHLGFTMRTASEYIPIVKEVRTHGGKSPLPRAFHLGKYPFTKELPHVIFQTEDKKTSLKILHLQGGKKTPAMTNTDGDEVWFVYNGTGYCDTVLGYFFYKPRTYIYIPKSYTYALSTFKDTLLIGIESAQTLRRPTFNWVNDTVPWSEHDIALPEPWSSSVGGAKENFEVYVKRAHIWNCIVYERSPFSSLGYQGFPYPFLLDTKHISVPKLDREHTDPTSFMTFSSPVLPSLDQPEVGISTFLSHRVHSLPYYHTNTYDECLFLAEDYKARAGILGAGDMSFHPQGFPHGPQPRALSTWVNPRTPEDLPFIPMCGVMFESRSPLFPLPPILNPKIEVSDYYTSWYKQKNELDNERKK